mgnify:CR=1 FL=1
MTTKKTTQKAGDDEQAAGSYTVAINYAGLIKTADGLAGAGDEVTLDPKRDARIIATCTQEGLDAEAKAKAAAAKAAMGKGKDAE